MSSFSSTSSACSSDSEREYFERTRQALESLQASTRADSQSHSYTTVSVRGVPQNPSLDVAKFEDIIDNFETRESDVFIATYVKAGTTWTQQIIHCLLKENGIDSVGASYGATVPWLEATASEFLQSREAPSWTLERINAVPPTQRRYFKTHATVRDLPRKRSVPGGKPCKVIAVCRNPKDTVVSLYHHSKSKPEFKFADGSFQTFYKIFLSGDAENGDWFDHALGWYHESLTQPESHLFLRYEDMIDDPAAAVRKIAAFLDIPLADEETVARVVKGSSISEMRGSSSDIGLNHLRQGGYGNWRTMFTVQMSEFFDDVYRLRMHGSGLGLQFNFGKNSRGEDVIF